MSYQDRIMEYEYQKRILAQKNLSPNEYAKRIREIARKLKI